MTPFEIIILIIIYMICYGFVLEIFLEEEKDMCTRILFSIVSLALAFYAPLTIGKMLYNKLKGE